MAKFEIDGKEYDLKLTFESVNYLNGTLKGGSYELIGKALAGDFETFPQIVYAGLLHTGEKFTLKKVKDEIANKFANEELTLDYIQTTSNEVVSECFFYAPTVKKMLDKNPEMKKALEQIM